MLTDAEIISAASRLTAGKLSGSDVDSLVSSFRLVLGPLEDRKKAAKMAACHLRLVNEDFGVSNLRGSFENSDDEQRRLFIIYALSILYPIPIELMDEETFSQYMRSATKFASSVPVTIVPYG
jgi:hypothetical protein